MFVLPTITAPAARSRRTTSGVLPGRGLVAATAERGDLARDVDLFLDREGYAVQRTALTVAESRASASASASSAITTVKALSAPSYRWMRSSTPSTSSREVTSPSATAAAWPVDAGPEEVLLHERSRPQRRSVSTTSARVTWTSWSRSTFSSGECASSRSPGP